MRNSSRILLNLNVDRWDDDPAAQGGATVGPRVHGEAREGLSRPAGTYAEQHAAPASLANRLIPFSIAVVPVLDRNDRPGRAVTLLVTGELDMATAPELDRQLGAVLAVGQVEIIIDMDAMDFIDCAGIDVLMLASRTARRAGGFLVLEKPSRVVTRMIQILNLHELVSRPAPSAEPLVASTM